MIAPALGEPPSSAAPAPRPSEAEADGTIVAPLPTAGAAPVGPSGAPVPGAAARDQHADDPDATALHQGGAPSEPGPDETVVGQAPADATLVAQPAVAAAPEAAPAQYNPQWDADRGTYILWEPARGMWLGWDEQAGEWKQL
jgi:hypothetical protein